MAHVWQSFRRIRWIVLHETGGPPHESPSDLAARIAEWPLYHWLIYPDGRIVKCAPPSRLLYHVTDHNVGTLSFAVVGNYKSREPTPALVTALEDLIEYVHASLIPGIESIIGHGEIDRTVDCPGKWWRAWLREYRARVGTSEARQKRAGMAVYPVTYRDPTVVKVES